jgi:MFS family permease
MTSHAVDSRYAWIRLVVALVLMTIGSSAMYVIAVVLPSVQAEFGVARAEASLPYTLLMVGFGIGGVFMGRLADRRGVALPLLIGAAGLGLGFIAAALSGNVGPSRSPTACSDWSAARRASRRWSPTPRSGLSRRGIGRDRQRLLSPAIQPPIVQHFVSVGWRQTYLGMGVFGVTMTVLALFMRARRPWRAAATVARAGAPGPTTRPFGMSLNAAQTLLCIAGVACCVRWRCRRCISSPTAATSALAPRAQDALADARLRRRQPARLGLDLRRIGGLRTLLLSSLLQGAALTLFLPFDSLLLVSRRLGCSACFRAGSCRRTRSSFASISRQLRQAGASARS